MITEPHVLPPDVQLVSVRELPARTRSRLVCADEDYAISRPRSRTSAMIIDARGAALLDLFRTSRPIVDAVLHYSRAEGLDAERLLEDALPLVRRMIDAGFLVLAGSRQEAPIEPSLRANARVGGYAVLTCLQALEDSELYQARGTAGAADGALVALKIGRGGRPRIRQQLEREAGILRHLGGRVTPSLIEAGLDEERPYIAMVWCEGVDAAAAADDLRAARVDGRSSLLRLCRSIAEAYAAVHEGGVVHGDVHPRNVLVDATGGVRLVDFGLARRLSSTTADAPARGGVGWFYEPEYAAARLASERPPPATPAGEQYAVAALLYSLCTGGHYLEFAIDKDRALRQIVTVPPLRFAARGVAAWPDLEHVLARALAKAPAGRFPTMAAFAAALAGISTGSQPMVSPPASVAPRADSPARRLLDRMLPRLTFGGSLFAHGITTEPTCSVNHGAAGVAYALYRVAAIRDDSDLLAAADVWSTRAAAGSSALDAFYTHHTIFTPDKDRYVALYHTVTGVYCVRALVALALGDNVGARRAAEDFAGAAAFPALERDLTMGRAGMLLGAALLHDAMPASPYLDRGPLRRLGEAVHASLAGEVSGFARVGDEPAVPSYGVAHGWAGLLYAILRWCRSTHAAAPAWVDHRLRELAERGEPWGRGIRWRWLSRGRTTADAESYMAGWCNGSAGFVHLWTLAHRVFADPEWLGLAERSAWHVWETRAAGGAFDLCCGAGGRAYALLEMYRHSGDRAWLERAAVLADHAATHAEPDATDGHALYKGALGVALLAVELERPDEACMPLFGDEQWPAAV